MPIELTGTKTELNVELGHPKAALDCLLVWTLVGPRQLIQHASLIFNLCDDVFLLNEEDTLLPSDDTEKLSPLAQIAGRWTGTQLACLRFNSIRGVLHKNHHADDNSFLFPLCDDW